MSHEKYEEYQDCIAACHACAVACNHCAASCLQEPDVKALVRCIGLDTDCAQICQLAVAFMSGGSDHAPAACPLCADICEPAARNARATTWTTASNAPKPAAVAWKRAARCRWQRPDPCALPACTPQVAARGPGVGASTRRSPPTRQAMIARRAGHAVARLLSVY